MQLKLTNVPYQKIVFFDIEYDQNLLVQLAFLILGAKEPSVFELEQSVNIYIKPSHAISKFFADYTNITNDYLRHNGVDLPGARSLVDEVLFNVDFSNCLLVGHGIDNDLHILQDTHIPLAKIKNRYDTYEKGKKILQRSNRLTLKDLAAEGGYYMFNEHNAYADAWGVVHAFAWLNEMENIDE